MKKIYLRIVAFLLVLAGLISLVSFLIAPKSYQAYNYVDVTRTVKQVHHEQENTLDTIFIGDSLVYSAYSPVRMYGEQGFTSFNCATLSQRLCDSYAILENVFRFQNPSVVVLEMNGIYRTAGVFDEEDAVLTKAGEIFSYLHYHSFYKLLKSPLELLRKENGKGGAYESKGFSGKEGVKKVDSDTVGDKGTEFEIPKDSSEYILKIEALCKENNSQLLLISTPSALEGNWCIEKSNAVTQYAQEHQIPFLDMNLINDEIQIDWNEDSVDGGDHLNMSGAKKVSTFIAEYLVNHYELPDHRNDEKYQEWNEFYQKLIRKKGTK